MAIVTLQDIHKSYGPDVVFDGLSLQFHASEKVGMVGPNGSGKTTIFRLILGRTLPDVGQVTTGKGLRIGYLPQEPTFDPTRTVMQQMHAGVEHILILQERLEAAARKLEAVTGVQLEEQMRQYERLSREFELAGGFEYETRINTTLAGLGFEEHLHHAKIAALSGGQLSRLGLAQVLMLETDLLLLDEPTNHLDLQATEWLEKFLRSYNGAAIVISHDRYLLDRVASKIVEIENGRGKVWKGNYSNYIATRETVRLQEEREHQKRVEMVERTRDFIARNKDQEGMRKTARGRKTRLERLLKENPDYLDRPTDRQTIDFSFAPIKSRSDLILRCEHLKKAFGDVVLFEDLSLDLLQGERLGITGPNGTGKSTFVKLALGEQDPSGGSIRLGRSLTVGYLDQHGEVLDPDKTVLDEARSVRPDLMEQQVRNLLGTFLFTGDDVFKKTADLSGGQQNRLMLCRLVLREPDVLIMDEPTNHLDIASREMLEEALAEYDGTVIVVSHDRFFLDKTVDKLLIVGVDEYGRRQVGKTAYVVSKAAYSLYAKKVQERQEQLERQKAQNGAAKKPRRAGGDDKPAAKTPEELRHFNRYTVEQIEEMILDEEEQLEEMKQRFGDETIYQNPEKLAKHQQDYDRKTAHVNLLYRAYEHRTG